MSVRGAASAGAGRFNSPRRELGISGFDWRSIDGGIGMNGPWSALGTLPNRRTRKGRRREHSPIVEISLAKPAGTTELKSIFPWRRRSTTKGLAMPGVARGRVPCHATWMFGPGTGRIGSGSNRFGCSVHGLQTNSYRVKPRGVFGRCEANQWQLPAAKRGKPGACGQKARGFRVNQRFGLLPERRKAGTNLLRFSAPRHAPVCVRRSSILSGNLPVPLSRSSRRRTGVRTRSRLDIAAGPSCPPRDAPRRRPSRPSGSSRRCSRR